MITVAKNVLKSKMLQYFRRVEEEGEELIVTHNGVPTLKVVPIEGKKPTVDELFADARKTAKIHGDLTEPDLDVWGENLR